MRILLLNQAFYPDVAATAQYLAELASALQQAGHQVSVVTSRRGYTDPELLYPARETWKGIEIYRVFSAGLAKGPKWKRAIVFASFIVSCCLRLISLPRQDVVIALTSPPLISFIGAWFAKLRRSRFIYWVMDLNPDEAIAAGWLRKDSLLTRILEGMSRFSLRRADRVIVLDRFMRALVTAKGVMPDKAIVIPPWSHDDEVRFDGPGRDRFRKEHRLEGKFVTMYSGNHSPCHPLDTVLEAAKLLANDPAFAFCFVGGGSEFARVKQFANAHDLKNIICLPYQPLEHLAGSLSAADLHVVVMGNAFVGTIHPCKIYNIMAVGAPVLYIGPATSHVADLLKTLKAWPFASVPHGDSQRVVAEIQRLAGASHRPPPETIRHSTAEFSKNSLLPRLIQEIG